MYISLGYSKWHHKNGVAIPFTKRYYKPMFGEVKNLSKNCAIAIGDNIGDVCDIRILNCVVGLSKFYYQKNLQVNISIQFQDIALKGFCTALQ